MKKSDLEQQVETMRQRIKELELKIVRLEAENSVLREMNHMPRPQIIREIVREPPVIIKRHPDVSPKYDYYPFGRPAKIQSQTPTIHQLNTSIPESICNSQPRSQSLVN